MLNLPGKLGLKLPRIDVGTLLSAARKATGLSDFGGERFLEPLSILIDSLERESQLTTLGRLSVRETIGRYLRNRL
ncbi:MAG: sulfotransferase, partial [Deltaproteobacteria bacterium]|nr:sulfotransferase [Deltaproteobacteria bacterium]